MAILAADQCKPCNSCDSRVYLQGALGYELECMTLKAADAAPETSNVGTVGRIAVVLMSLAVLSPRCLSQVSNSAQGSETRGENPALSFTGCYELQMGRWWPWSFGSDTVFVTPPTRIELLPEPGTNGFEKDGLLIRAISPKNGMPSGRGGFSYWQVRSGNQVDLVWTDGFTGVTVALEKHGDELTGWAHPHFDISPFVPRIAHVTAKRIPCEHSL
jgi:hypothetical protein